jgi:hypothetical protein
VEGYERGGRRMLYRYHLVPFFYKRSDEDVSFAARERRRSRFDILDVLRGVRHLTQQQSLRVAVG